MIDNKTNFSDWLIASDIDGTINDKSRHLVKRNYDAVQKFVKEYKGNFTLASGRSPNSMRKHYKRLNDELKEIVIADDPVIAEYDKMYDYFDKEY